MRQLGLGVLLSSCFLVGCAGAKAASATTASSVPAAAPVATQPQADPEPEPAESKLAADDDDEEDVKADGTWIAGAAASTYLLPSAHEELVGVWVDVPKELADIHVPTALSLAIDTSGSMRGDKIVHAREAATRLVESLQEGDIVSIVAFSSSAEVVVRPTEITPRTRRHVLAVIEELSADGGTALHQGLSTAGSLLHQHRDTHLVRRAIVISDGKATVGPSDPHTLGAVAEGAMSVGIQYTSLGVGLDYDEITLDEIAVRSSGRLYHIEESSELASIIEEEVSLLAATVAADASIEILPARGVRLAGLDRARWQHHGTGIRVPLGSLHAGQRREILVRTHVDAHDEGERPLVSVRLHFRDPSQAGVARVQERIVSATVTDDPTLVAEHENPRTQAIIAMRETAMLTLAAAQKANAGRLDGAEEDLAFAEQRLRRQAKSTKSKRERKRMTQQADRLSEARSGIKAAAGASGSGRATRSRKTALDLNDAAMDAYDH